MKRLFVFYRMAREELDKVIFPTKEQIRNASISVLVVVSVIALFLSLIGVIFGTIASSIL
ncbi:preprotein translocase subunit SecE [Helicobacter sp. MIT 99-5507]|uniref:preprotein translocase subunit SecE n=1 Tax=Helicobacter sp. MIT 99-5507 TaxID=152489 RepID=UPI000E1F61A4|nr:preprotein translocase subunit SecE [Helicobacter sp. MIT 99-5507]RDU57415.1 preprotein translocase subunit SecE [Helicobacter sp. MIT 99-5507]